MKRILEKYYPIYIGLIMGIPVWTLTYFVMGEEWHNVFWFMILIYALFIIIQQLKWNRG